MGKPSSDIMKRRGLGWPCAKCGKQVYKTLAWLKDHTSYTCPACGITTQIPERDRQRFIARLESIDDVVEVALSKKALPKKKH